MNDSHPSSMPKRSSKMTSATRMRLAAGVAAMVGFAVAAATMASCTADDGARLRGNTMGAGGGSSGNVINVDPNAPCNSGATIECHQTIGTNDDILTCLHGEKTCVNGSWGPCVGAFSSRADWQPTSSASATNNPDEVHILGLSDAGPCENNPCDPYCQDYEEVPGADAGYQVVPEITTVWTAGSFDDLLDGLPPGFVNKGITNPCTSSADCQFDSHCLPTGTNGITCADNAARCCMAWNPLEYAMCNPARPDVSLGLACIRPDGIKIVPVCN
ncbi:MAG TPA: hypothetical protein PK156_46045, partial [Polyangium sp.]|nr:hypothetical protein [Polyangium sp.]